jgi:TRAP-type mannitol/chloroaromatic compound transport system substrate-binding protein
MSTKINFALNIGTLVVVLIALIAGAAISIDLYDTVHKAVDQSQENSIQISTTAEKLNKSYDQIIQAQDAANDRGNVTINSFVNLFKRIIDSEENIIGNLSDHRRIANQTRDNDYVMLQRILNQTSK